MEKTDCRSELGITVGLIDSLISICRVLRPRVKEIQEGEPGMFNASPVLEALKDLYADEDLKFILGALPRWVSHIKTVYPEWPGNCLSCKTEHAIGPCPQNKVFLFNKGRLGKPRERSTEKQIVYEYREL